MANTVPENKTRNDELKKLHAEGWSYNQLAKRYDISVQRVHQIIKHYNTYWKRIKGECFFCGSVERLHKHHIDGYPNNNHPSNLIALCMQCHKKLHKLARLLNGT